VYIIVVIPRLDSIRDRKILDPIQEAGRALHIHPACIVPIIINGERLTHHACIVPVIIINKVESATKPNTFGVPATKLTIIGVPIRVRDST
jgi:hypothetical protein